MPLSEFYRMARGKLESGQQKTTTCLTDLSHVPDNEFVELVWENGQIMMQGQSSRARRSPTSSNVQNQTPKLRDKDLGNTTNSKMGKFGAMDSVLNEFPSVVPSGEMGFGQDDDMVPWLNYPIDDSLQHGYCSELLPELSGVTVNEPSAQNSFSSIGKRYSCNQTIRGSHSVSAHNGSSLEQANASKVSSSENGEPSRSRGSQFHLWSFQESQTPTPSHRSGVSGIINNSNSSTKHSICMDSIQDQASAGGFPSRKIQKQDSGLPSTNPGFMNFSYFSRPAALVRANLQNVGAMATSGASSSIEAMQGKNKGTDPSNSNPAESAPIDLSSGLIKEMESKNQPNVVSSNVDLEPVVARPPLEESCPAEQSEAVCREDLVKNNKLPDEVGAGTLKGMPDGEKTLEPVVASSSVCSGNGAERASNDLMHNLKRKCHDVDDSEGRSEDIEEESVGVRKAASARGGGAGSKRSRAAEVHNLSERRRRDRINEKMRALQELIPNCNKVDKASMLDEAIEYLKTLQLQVQIMSMGAGLYMPPMMLPTGMQHVHPAHMAHFSPMAVGMGMGMGYGMGMLDMNGGSTGCPMIQVPPMQGAHFPAPHPSPISVSTSFHEMAGSNPQVFKYPGQGFPMSAPCPHLVPLSGGLPINSAVGLNVDGMAAAVEVPNSAPSSTPDNLRHNTNTQITDNTDASSFVNQKSSQCQATNEGFEQAPLMRKTDQAPDVGSGDNLNFGEENDTSPSRPACCD